MFSNGEPQALHTTANVHSDDDIFGGRGCLDVPEKEEQIMEIFFFEMLTRSDQFC